MISYKHLTYFCILSVLLSCILIAGCTEQPKVQTTQPDRSTWTIYADKSDGFKISHPSDWSVVTSKTTPIRVIDKTKPYVTMENVIHIYSPDTDTAVQIMGFAYPPSLQYEDGISDSTYNIITDALRDARGENVIPVSITTDAYSYVLNGNSARRLQATVLINNKPKFTETYIIRHDTFYYLVSYVIYEESSGKQYSQTAIDIIKTFRTVEWAV
jgi:hypothetical protein